MSGETAGLLRAARPGGDSARLAQAGQALLCCSNASHSSKRAVKVLPVL